MLSVLFGHIVLVMSIAVSLLFIWSFNVPSSSHFIFSLINITNTKLSIVICAFLNVSPFIDLVFYLTTQRSKCVSGILDGCFSGYVCVLLVVLSCIAIVVFFKIFIHLLSATTEFHIVVVDVPWCYYETTSAYYFSINRRQARIYKINTVEEIR